MNLAITKTDTAIVKGIAIIAMLMHHVFGSLTGQSWVIDQLQVLGKVCVALFVLLSGYGMAIGYMRITPPPQKSNYSQGVVSLLIHRLLKFYMNYWVIFLIFVPLGVFVFGRPLSAAYPENLNTLKCLFVDFFALRGLGSYNITWWFNKLILILYVLSPVIFVFTQQFPIGTILVVFVLQRLGLLSGTYSLNWYLMPFVLGFVWAQNAERVQGYLNKLPQWVGVVMVLVLVLVVAYCRQMSILLRDLEWDTYLAVAITLVVVVLSSYFRYTRAILFFFGKHSINIYLIHTFVFYYFLHDEIYALGNPWLILLIVTAITLTCSIVLEFIKDKTKINKFLDCYINKFINFTT